jgi:hypothetical protein
MSDRSMWKMLHLLYTAPPGPGVPMQQLIAAGIDCGPDTYGPLEMSGAVQNRAGIYSLSAAVQQVFSTCLVANRRWSAGDMWVDDPSAFVVMPFGEPWSEDVYRNIIESAVKTAGLECVRGDLIVRVGDLSQNIWSALLHAGIIIAECSVANPNVFYEVGLAHALGKVTIILRQRDSAIPADMGGAHYHEYDLVAPNHASAWLRAELEHWCLDNQSIASRAIRTP